MKINSRASHSIHSIEICLRCFNEGNIYYYFFLLLFYRLNLKFLWLICQHMKNLNTELNGCHNFSEQFAFLIINWKKKRIPAYSYRTLFSKSFKNRMLAAKHQKLFALNFLHSVKNLLRDCYANVRKSLGAILSF